MQVINGDLLDIKEGVIIHQVNCKKRMGSGIALQIKKKYPQHYEDYIEKTPYLGDTVISKVSENPELFIIGIYGQNSYGKNYRHTNYEAFATCLERIKEIHVKSPNRKFYMPYGIGCGLGGANWTIIQTMINEICPFITLVKKNGG